MQEKEPNHKRSPTPTGDDGCDQNTIKTTMTAAMRKRQEERQERRDNGSIKKQQNEEIIQSDKDECWRNAAK